MSADRSKTEDIRVHSRCFFNAPLEHLILNLMSRTWRNHLSISSSSSEWEKISYFAHSIGLMCYIQVFFFSPISNCLEIVMWLVFFYRVSNAFTAAIERLGSDKKIFEKHRGDPRWYFYGWFENVGVKLGKKDSIPWRKPYRKKKKKFRTVGVHDQTRSYHWQNKS